MICNCIRNGSAQAGLRMATLTFCFLLAQYATALAQHDDHTDMMIGADGDGSGALVLEYPFDEIPSVRVTDTGFAGLFSSVDPGFMPSLDEPLEGATRQAMTLYRGGHGPGDGMGACLAPIDLVDRLAPPLQANPADHGLAHHLGRLGDLQV